MSTAIAAKLAVVFGVGTNVSAVYTKDEVVFSDPVTKVSVAFPVDDTSRKEPGMYNVSIVSDTELVQTLITVAPPVAEAKEEPAKPIKKQSPAYGFASKVTR